MPGLTIEPSPAARDHLVVTSIRSGVGWGSPQAPSGIAVGDTVVAIDGERIFSLDQARRRLQTGKARTVALRVVHGRELRDVRLARSIPGSEADGQVPHAAAT